MLQRMDTATIDGRAFDNSATVRVELFSNGDLLLLESDARIYVTARQLKAINAKQSYVRLLRVLASPEFKSETPASRKPRGMDGEPFYSPETMRKIRNALT